MGRLALSKGKGPPVAPDTTPNAIVFADNLAAALDTDIIVRATLSGTNANASMTVLSTSTSYSINGGAYATTLPVDVPPGATIDLKRHSSSSNSTSTNVGCTIGGVASSGGTITTVAADTTPDAFTIPAKTGQALDSDIWSADVTPTGYTNDAAISGTGLGVKIDGGSAVSSGTISPGQSFKIGLHTSASNSTLVTATATVGGVSADFNGTTLVDSDIVTVGPHADWDGTADTGAGEPDGLGEARTGARVVAYFLNPSFQRVSGDTFNVKVVADCFDGVASVTFSGDVADQTISTSALRTNTDVNGLTKYERVFDIDLDIAACLAASASGNTLHIYATCEGNNAGMQRRVIGPLILYPEATAHDWTATVTPDGLNDDGSAAATPTYTTIRAALNAATTAVSGGPPHCGKITFVKTASYDLTNAGGYTDPGRGYLVVTHDPGVVATLRRTSRSTTDFTSNHWIPGFNGIEWRGEGIVFDQRYWQATLYQNSSSRPPWFNGCKFTNSLGSSSASDYNKGAHPGCGAQGNSSTSLPAYYTDVTIEYNACPCQSMLMATGIKTKEIYGDLYSNTGLVYGTYDKNPTSNQMRTERAAMTLAWNGTPGAATIQFTKGDATSTCVIVDPSGTLTLSCRNVDAGGANDVWTFSQFKTKIEAHNAGWAITVQSDDIRAQMIYGGSAGLGGSENGFGPYTVTSTPVQVNTFQAIHGDWWQGSHGSADCEQIFLSRSVLLGDSINLSSSLNFDSRNQWDTIFTENSFEDNNSLPGFWTAIQHVVARHNFTKQGLQFSEDQDEWCEISNNVLGTLQVASGTWPTTPRIINNATVGTAHSDTGETAGNFQIGSLDSVFVDRAAGDYRPDGDLLTNLKTPSEPSDIRGIERGATDAVGPNADGGDAAVYPF